MKSTSTLIGAALLLGSSAVFAAPQTAAHPAGQAPAAGTATSTATSAHPATRNDLKYEKHQVRVEEKTALAACKAMKGAQKSNCRKDAVAKANTARQHLKAAKHA